MRSYLITVPWAHIVLLPDSPVAIRSWPPHSKCDCQLCVDGYVLTEVAEVPCHKGSRASGWVIQVKEMPCLSGGGVGIEKTAQKAVRVL